MVFPDLTTHYHVLCQRRGGDSFNSENSGLRHLSSSPRRTSSRRPRRRASPPARRSCSPDVCEVARDRPRVRAARYRLPRPLAPALARPPARLRGCMASAVMPACSARAEARRSPGVCGRSDRAREHHASSPRSFSSVRSRLRLQAVHPPLMLSCQSSCWCAAPPRADARSDASLVCLLCCRRVPSACCDASATRRLEVCRLAVVLVVIACTRARPHRSARPASPRPRVTSINAHATRTGQEHPGHAFWRQAARAARSARRRLPCRLRADVRLPARALQVINRRRVHGSVLHDSPSCPAR